MNKTKLFPKSNIYSDSINRNKEEENIDKLISVSIKLNKEYSKFKKLIIESNHNIENQCYLIKKNFIESIEEILFFKEIDDIINQKGQQLKSCHDEKEKIEKIKKEIEPKTIKFLKELDKQVIEYELDSKELAGFDLPKILIGEKSYNAFYYGECILISKDIFEIFEDMIKRWVDKIKGVKSIFDKGEIIILIKDGIDEVINVGNLEGRNSLKIKYIIQKESKNLELSDIFSEFKYSGYDLINKYLPYGHISYKNKEAKIYSLLKQNNLIEKKPLKLDISNLTTINFKKAYIVKKDVINKLKRIYNINEVITYLNNHHQLNEINYKNLETNYQNLSKFLNENQINNY